MVNFSATAVTESNPVGLRCEMGVALSEDGVRWRLDSHFIKPWWKQWDGIVA